MNNLQIMAILQIALSLIFGICALYSTKYLLDWYFKKRYSMDIHSLSYVIFAVVVMFSVGFIMSGITTPLISLIRLINVEMTILNKVITFFSYTIGFWFLGIFLSFITLYLTLHIFTYLTDADEFKDIKQGQLPSILIVSIVLIVIVLFVKDGYTLLLESLLPYPEVVGFN